MAILKLQNEGDAHTATATSVTPVQGQYGEQVEFVFTNGDKVFLPKESADRQLDRLGLDYASAVGVALTFSRDHNPKKGAKPYWGIAFATAQERTPPPPSRRVPSPHQPKPASGPSGGAHVPDMDDDEPYSDGAALDGIPDWHRNVPPADAPAPTPRETREAATGVTDRERHYLALWDRVAAHLTVTCQRHRIPLDASAVQAATFSIFNQR